MKNLHNELKIALLALLLLLPCVCEARYYEYGGLSIESVLEKDYNVQLGFDFGITNVKYVFFSFNWFSFRVIKDAETSRFYTSVLLTGLTLLTKDVFNSLYENPQFFEAVGGIIPSIPLMLMNPTIGLKLTERLNIAVGYNTDFCFIPRWETYFAPKIKLGLINLAVIIDEKESY